MKTLYLLTRLTGALLLFVSFSSFSQKNLIPGYILTVKGDTVHGFIDYNGRSKVPSQLGFTPALDNTDARTSFEKFPGGIKGFKAGNDSFVKAEVSVERSPKKTTDAGFKLEQETVFLQVLVDGPKALYHYKDYNGRDNFYIKVNDTFELLKYKQYEQFSAGKITILKNQAFPQQLSKYLDDCEPLQESISRARYLKSSLLNLFERYYQYTGQAASVEKREPIRHEWNVVGGFSTTTLTFTSETFHYLDKGNFAVSHNPSAGIRLDFIFPKHRELLSLRNELAFSSYSTTGSYTHYLNENNRINYRSEFAYSYFKVNNLLQLNFPVKGIRFFLNAGISNGYALSEKNKTTEEHIFLEQVEVSEKKAIAATRKYEQGALAGVGVRHKRLSLEARYEFGDGMSKVFRVRSNTERIFALLGYRISR